MNVPVMPATDSTAVLAPHAGEQLRPLGDVFLKMIKMVIGLAALKPLLGLVGTVCLTCIVFVVGVLGAACAWAGVYNLFDRRPPIVGPTANPQLSNGNQLASIYDGYGRYLCVGDTAKY